jgi:hypothetical protein
MENKNMEISSFLKNNQIPFCNIWYYISDTTGKKTPIGEKNNIKDVAEIKTAWYVKKTKPTSYSFKNKTTEKYDTCELSQTEYDSLKYAVSIYLKHSPQNIYCVDIDDYTINKSLEELIKKHPQFEVFKNCSYLEGNNKGIHIYVKIEGVPENAKELSVFKNIDGDLIRKNNNMWENSVKKFSGSAELLTFQFDDIKQLFNNRIYGEDKAEGDLKEGKKKIKKEGKEELKEFEKIPITEDDEKLINLIPANMFFEYVDWIKLVWIFKSVGFSFDVFDNLSKKNDKLGKYKAGDNLLKWNTTRMSKINIGLIHHIVKKANPEEYKKLNIKRFYKQEEERKDIIKFSSRYLLPEKFKGAYNKEKINDTNDLLQKNVIKLFNDDEIKSLSLKSPYGTGKTQMIKSIINTFNPKNILWITYRKTLTNNIIGGEKFGEEYGFKSYQENKFDADRLIIQLESILKLSGQMSFFDEEYSQYPSYDMVIIDEVESILSQFNSPTFKGASKECFEFLQNVIINSKKLLVLDGDISNRTYKYIDTFGKCINLVNDIKINKRTFKITHQRNDFIETIDKDLDKNKKVVIVSMASTQCETFSNRLKEKYPKKCILSYTGSSSDTTKKDFNDVDNIWDKADVLIYSPTCEAGVNFDKKHFDKMYGIFTDKSTTPRGLLQMFARIRQIEETEILILNECFKNNNVKNDYYFCFDEVKNSILALEGIQLKTDDIMIDGKMCKTSRLNPYDTNYIYNRMEQLNASSYYFLSYLEMMCINKGHEFKILDDKLEKGEKKPEAIDADNKVSKIDILLNTEDINLNEYEEFLQKQQKDNATEEEKQKISRYFYKKAVGIDILEDNQDSKEFCQKFNVNSINNFISLINADNIKESEDNQTKEYKDKAELINKLINDMGFDNMFDNKQILKDDFVPKMENILKTNPLFTNQLNTQIRFNLNKTKKIESVKGFLGFVNSLFDSYNIALSYDRKRVKGEKEKKACYHLEILNDINELLEYKIRRGFKLHDEKNIRPKSTTETYKSFIDFEKLEKIEKKLAEKAEKENLPNPLDFGIN